MLAKKDGTFVKREKRVHEEISKPVVSEAMNIDNSTNQPPAKQVKLVVNNIPHNILFAQQLPDNCTQETLTSLFQSYIGFKEVRTVPGKKSIAFIEFNDHIQASVALKQLNGFKLNGGNEEDKSQILHLTFGKQ